MQARDGIMLKKSGFAELCHTFLKDLDFGFSNLQFYLNLAKALEAQLNSMRLPGIFQAMKTAHLDENLINLEKECEIFEVSKAI